MSFSDALFWVFAATAVLPAFGILIGRGIVRMAFLLLFSLAGFAGLYLLLGAGFLGFTQVLVYIGGILILFLFGVMLTARTEVPVRKKLSPTLLVPAVVAGLAVLAVLLYATFANPWSMRGSGPQPRFETPEIGRKLLGDYLLPFEAVSVLLLVAMVGATYMARGRGESKE